METILDLLITEVDTQVNSRQELDSSRTLIEFRVKYTFQQTKFQKKAVRVVQFLLRAAESARIICGGATCGDDQCAKSTNQHHLYDTHTVQCGGHWSTPINTSVGVQNGKMAEILPVVRTSAENH